MKHATTVIDFSEARQRLAAARQVKPAEPAWLSDIKISCAYAELVRAEHDAESARIHYEAELRGSVWNREDDLRSRTETNNLEWQRYICLLAHIATIPATSRGDAQRKRNTIPKMWLAANSTLGRDPTHGTIGQNFHDMRAGCLADDHLFPPSMRLARANTKKGG